MNLFAKPAGIEIRFQNEELREKVDVRRTGSQTGRMLIPLYTDTETVNGTVLISNKGDSYKQHKGITVRFVGAVERLIGGDVAEKSEFMSLSEELSGPDNANALVKHDFAFKNVEKKYESYSGLYVRLRYFVEVSIHVNHGHVITDSRDIWVYKYTEINDVPERLTISAGIAQQLVVEIDFMKPELSMKDTLIGKLHFKVVNIKITTVHVQLNVQETYGTGENIIKPKEMPLILDSEVVEGNPAEGETIPIRLHLEGLDLTPTMSDIHNRFSVRTILTVCIIDEARRRYYKRVEIKIRRTID